MKDLIERLEKATEPDRELDKDILFATFPRDRVAIFDGVKHISTITGRGGEAWFGPLADRDDCPRYTNSIDDAMDLVPDGWLPEISSRHYHDGISWEVDIGHMIYDATEYYQHRILPIALCMAALDARYILEGADALPSPVAVERDLTK